jgi:hypothetical protein
LRQLLRYTQICEDLSVPTVSGYQCWIWSEMTDQEGELVRIVRQSISTNHESMRPTAISNNYSAVSILAGREVKQLQAALELSIAQYIV